MKLPGQAQRKAILRLNLKKHADEVAFLEACAREAGDPAPAGLPTVDDALLQVCDYNAFWPWWCFCADVSQFPCLDSWRRA